MSDIDQKKLLNQILPKARKVGVSEELRGWNWYKSPLKPYYDDTKIPMYSVCSQYCPTRRDVFVNIVKGAKGVPSKKVIQGSAIHETVRTAFNTFIEGQFTSFESWYSSVITSKGVVNIDPIIKERSRNVWQLTWAYCESRLRDLSSRQPYASKRDIIATALPFLIEHRITGELLGLSGLLKIDCFDYLRDIVFDIKVSDESLDWYRLYPTGYSLVIESVYEVPVDVGCTVYIRFKDDNLIIDKDLFFINDDLRSWWVEERDEKLKIVSQKLDPGFPNICSEDCMYRLECRVEENLNQ
ncbi:type I-A CRISPR-associated protein Cas4/Csa1 [Candidatus Bathyarchaeota archaeon]|nr:type I-A CRISPR-associated protein Cas4/Csa1 [Candidatus Bathyarchaeota archaeon]